MKQKKVVILLISLLIVVIIIILTFLNIMNNSNDPHGKYYADPEEEEYQIEIEKTMQNVTVRNQFYIVKNCIKKFYMEYADIYDYAEDILIWDEDAIASQQKLTENNIEEVYNMLDAKYIEYKEITSENLTSKLSNVNHIKANNLNVIINQMYVSQKSENMNIYFAKGLLIDKVDEKKYDFSMIVNVDMLNKTFSIILSDYIDEKIGDIEVNSNINIEIPDSIEDKTSNKFDYSNVTDSTYITDLFENYKFNMLYNPQKIYDSLDEEYRKERFPTAQEFKQYLINNSQKIRNMSIEKYLKNDKAKYTQYICLDTNNKYVYINEKSPVEYTFILDSYTIDSEEFIEKYDKSSEQVKVGMNIEKVFEAINDFDYEYIYNKLDETFKKNNFDTIEKFEKYMRENLYESNKVEYLECSEDKNIYGYQIKLKDSKNEYNPEKEMTIIMQLLDDRNFVMSFSM